METKIKLRNFALVLIFVKTFSIPINAQPEYKKHMLDLNTNYNQVCQEAEQYFSTIDKNKKASGWKKFLRWKYENESRYYPSGDRKSINHFAGIQSFQKLQSELKVRSAQPNWNNLGPFTVDSITFGYNSGIGRVECFELDSANKNLLFIGCKSGGFWKSIDGGKNWKNTTSQLPVCGVFCMDKNPFDPTEFLINSNQSATTLSHGIYRSKDVGESWQITQLNPNNGFGGLEGNLYVRFIAYHPLIKDLVFIGTSAGLYRSEDNLKTYSIINPEGLFTEIEFHPTDPKTIYLIDVLTTDLNTIKISNDAGKNFFSSAVIPGINGISGVFSVSPKEMDAVYFAYSTSIYKSINKGKNFQLLGKLNANTANDFAVSDVDSKIMIAGYVNAELSTDGGKTFKEISDWATTKPDSSYIHADITVAECHDGVFYLGTDGYLCKSSNNGKTWEKLNIGSCMREFYRIGISQSDLNIIIGGSQDMGTSILNHGKWIEWNGGDGTEAIIHPLNPKIFVGSYQNGGLNRSIDGGLTRDQTENPLANYPNTYWATPLIIDPSDHMNIFHFADTIYSNSNFGEMNSWKKIGSPKIESLNAAAIAENNSNLIVVSHEDILMLSTDKGKSWKSISAGLPNAIIENICFDPKNDSTIALCYGNFQNSENKVFISKNLGKTWSNINFNLGNMQIYDIIIDHSQDKNIYLAAEIGILVKPMNGTKWELYNEGLPNITVRDLEIHFASNTLIAATWGRGIWEVALRNRESFPRINSIETSTPISSFGTIPINEKNHIIADIAYTSDRLSTYLLWSHQTKSLENKIQMIFTEGKWKSFSAIPSAKTNEAVFFKIISVGTNQDTTESYTFMYRQSPCVNKNYTQNIQACDKAIISLDTFYTSTSFQKSYQDIYSCDSIIQFNVAIYPTPDSSVSNINNRLIANETNANSYQWLDCKNNFMKLEGDTLQALTANISGVYAVDIVKNNCSVRSSCHAILTTENHEQVKNKWWIIPNPNQGEFEIKFDNEPKSGKLQIFQTDGKEIYTNQIHAKETKLTIKNPGMYVMKITSGNEMNIKKIIVH